MDTENQVFPACDKQAAQETETGCFEPTKAAVKLQKVYRSYRTRRRLADSAVVAEELWWQAIQYARLNHSTISFFSFTKPETAASRWSRISLNASKVGKGSCKDDKAQKLAFQHWIEAIDPRHRYGHNLHIYYDDWCKRDTEQPFFYWLDIGDGKEVDLEECPRSSLRQECIKYLGPQEREHYEYIIAEGKLVHKLTGDPLDTTRERKHSKWIFVMSTLRKLYAGEKKKGMFHHSSFLAGATTLAAGRLNAQCGKLKLYVSPLLQSVSAYSGHYRPNDKNLSIFLTFLEENGVNLEEIQVIYPTEDHQRYDSGESTRGSKTELLKVSEPFRFLAPEEFEGNKSTEASKFAQIETRGSFKRSLSSSLQSPRVLQEEVFQRMKSKQERISYQLGHQLSRTWSTGAGPRIGCVADFPQKLRAQALEFVSLSSEALPSSEVSHFSPTLARLSNLCEVM